MRLSILEPKVRVVLSRYANRGLRHNYEDLLDWNPKRTKLLVSPTTTVHAFEEYVRQQNLVYNGVSDFVMDSNPDMVRVLLFTTAGLRMEGYRKLAHYRTYQSLLGDNREVLFEKIGTQMKVDFCVVKRDNQDESRSFGCTKKQAFNVKHFQPRRSEGEVETSEERRGENLVFPASEHTSTVPLKERKSIGFASGAALSRVLPKRKKADLLQNEVGFDFELISKDSGWVEVNSRSKAISAIDEEWSPVYFDCDEEEFEAHFI